MKRFMILLLSGMIFAGCKSSTFKASEKTLELKGNPTTGYTWIYTVEDDSIIQVSEKIKYLGKNGIVGAPSLFTYTIKSVKPGTTSLNFEYKRPWEEKAAEEVRTFEVNVKEDGTIYFEEL